MPVTEEKFESAGSNFLKFPLSFYHLNTTFQLKAEFITFGTWYLSQLIKYIIYKKGLMDLHEFFQLILLSSQI